ncbi:GFA family protein [Labrys sp. ZIDIC5]|uniref:GFA family protein n=1 Tax=Labrys sedimenti TaxID=3106036 RepID=UPI002ACAE518|nr:GFA family protein [Labrys sp. ZIDIC5]MDZ5453186.1 GFA family protein [Labrys sp. ZIDIC5]
MSATSVRATGSCLCGGVRYRIHGTLTPVSACHCSQCAKTSGNFVATTDCSAADLTLTAEDTLRWYRSSERAERGFCATCGGNLFWRSLGDDRISITAGTLDPPTGLTTRRHIFVASKSDYYDIADGAARFDIR